MPRIPQSLSHRSGYELRVIGYLDEKWPFVAEDRLAAAAHGVDVFKKKHPDDWQWLLEANAHPDAASETIVRTILKENSRLYRMAYDYDRRIAAKKIPVSKRSPLEQAIYWAEGARGWLLSGAPDVGRKDLEKAAAIIARDAGLKRIPGLASKLEACFKALSSYNPRGADPLVEAVVALLKGSSSVEPLTPDDASGHFAKAMASLRKHMRDLEVVRKPGPVRDPYAYDMTWTLRLAPDLIVAVMISYGAGKGVRLQVSEDRSGKITRILNEQLTRNYALIIQSCLSHWYDRAPTPW